MNITQTVKAAIESENGQPFIVDTLFSKINAGHEDNPTLTRSQIIRAMGRIGDIIEVDEDVFQVKQEMANPIIEPVVDCDMIELPKKLKGRAGKYPMTQAEGVYPRWVSINGVSISKNPIRYVPGKPKTDAVVDEPTADVDTLATA